MYLSFCYLRGRKKNKSWKQKVEILYKLWNCQQKQSHTDNRTSRFFQYWINHYIIRIIELLNSILSLPSGLQHNYTLQKHTLNKCMLENMWYIYELSPDAVDFYVKQYSCNTFKVRNIFFLKKAFHSFPKRQYKFLLGVLVFFL